MVWEGGLIILDDIYGQPLKSSLQKVEPFVETNVICQVSLKVDVTDIYLNGHAMNIYLLGSKSPFLLFMFTKEASSLKVSFPNCTGV